MYLQNIFMAGGRPGLFPAGGLPATALFCLRLPLND
jgi:hypothetical protein